jgi:hypothetical protein
MRLSAVSVAFLTVFSSQQVLANTVEQQVAEQAKQIEALQQQLTALTQDQKTNDNAVEGFSFSSYGSINYRQIEVFKNVQDENPESRSQVDVERVVAEFEYRFDSSWKVEFEIEFEHGGTGSTLEYDGFDEFGEFETEIEVGGEVVVEKLELEYKHSDSFGVKLGHIYVPVGLSYSHHKPHQYFTVQRHGSVESMIPSVWHETGIGVFGQLDNFHYQAQVVTGLNSEYFRTYNWVGGASQTRFETVNADDLAMVLRIDYGNIKSGNAFGVSYYASDTSANRHKTNQINENGHVEIFDIHGAYSHGPFTIRAQYLKGTLENSNEITQANRNTPGLGVGNFAQLGSEAQAMFIEAGYNISPLINFNQDLHIFASYDSSNPLNKVDNVFGSERFDIKEYAVGVNYFPVNNVVLKAQFGQQGSEMNSIPTTNSFELGFGYYFSL